MTNSTSEREQRPKLEPPDRIWISRNRELKWTDYAFDGGVEYVRAPVVVPEGDPLQVLTDLRGHFGPSNCWCDAEGDAPHLYCCAAARKLVEQLTAAPSPASSPVDHDSCPHWREGDSDNCVMCGDDLGPTTEADVATPAATPTPVEQEQASDDGSAEWCDDCHGYTHKYDCPSKRREAKTPLVDRVVDAVYRSMAQYESGEWWLDTLRAKARVKRLLDQSSTPSHSVREAAEESGWLLEKMHNGNVHYISADYVLQWTDDPGKALRLARREDAEALSTIVEDCEKIAPHEWVPAAPASPSLAEPPGFRNTKEAMEYARRNNIPAVIPVSAAGGDEDRLRWLLTRIIHDLPARHDWLDPDLEREARTYMK